MSYDMERGKRLHEVLVPKNKEVDVCECVDILMAYLSNMLHVSNDKFKNKAYFWTFEDFSRIIRERAHCQTKVNELSNEIDSQISKSLDAIVAWLQYQKDERDKKEKASQERKKRALASNNHVETETQECKK